MKQLISFVAGIIVAVLIGFGMFWIIHDPTITSKPVVRATEASASSSQTTSVEQVQSSTEPSETQETTQEEPQQQPSAQIPEWYDEAESYVPEYADMVQLGHDRNSTFPVDTAVDGISTAISCMAQIPENDGSYMADLLRAMLQAKGYPADNTLLTEDLITRAFHSAGWETAPNEEGYVNP